MPKIEDAHINPFGFREYDARWLYPKDINKEGFKKLFGNNFSLNISNLLNERYENPVNYSQDGRQLRIGFRKSY